MCLVLNILWFKLWYFFIVKCFFELLVLEINCFFNSLILFFFFFKYGEVEGGVLFKWC